MADINEVFVIKRANALFQSTGEILDVTSSITKISVKNDYSLNKMPLFTLDFRSTEEIYEKIRDDEIVLDLMISVCDYNTVTESLSMDKDIIIDDRIRIYEKPFDFINRLDDYDNDSTGNIENSSPFHSYTLSGTLEKAMSFNKLAANDVYRNTSPISALVHLMYKYGVGEISLDEGFNNRVYTDILIPPMPPLLTPEYLQNYYGVFDISINSFINVKNSVLIYDPMNISKIDNTVHIKVTKANTGNKTDNIRPNESGGNITIMDQNNPAFYTGGQIQKHLIGTKTTFFSYDSVFNVSNREYNSDNTFDKVRFFWNPDNNINSERSYFNGLKKSDGISYVLTNINPYRINPFTQFIVSSDSEIVSGKYSVNEVNYTLIPPDVGDFKYFSSMLYVNCIKKE